MHARLIPREMTAARLSLISVTKGLARVSRASALGNTHREVVDEALHIHVARGDGERVRHGDLVQGTHSSEAQRWLR